MKKLFTRVIALVALGLVGSVATEAQVTYYSKASATDFNSATSWGTNSDGSGTTPASITNADNYIVANGAILSLSGSAGVRQLTLSSGTLNVAANTLTVSIAGTYNSSVTVNSGGTLTVSGGTLNVNGNFSVVSGGILNQSAGAINVDGNNGGSTTGSVASGTYIVSLAASSASTINLSGGTFTVVDPHTSATNTVDINYSAVGAIIAGSNHTFRFGNGVSTDAGNSTYGFRVYTWEGTGIFNFGNVVIETNSGGANRFVLVDGQFFPFVVNGDMTINSGGEYRHTSTYAATGPTAIGGNLTVNSGGTFTSLGTVYLGTAVSASSTTLTFSATSRAQTISGSGTFRNSTTSASSTANFTSLTVNNTNTSGVTFSGANSLLSSAGVASTGTVSGTLTFTAGGVNLGGNTFALGTGVTNAGTMAYTAGGFNNGGVKRWLLTTSLPTTITPGTFSWPFLINGGNRNVQIAASVAPTAAGSITVSHTSAVGLAATSVNDNGYTIDQQTNATWSIATGDGLAGGTYLVRASGEGLLTTAAAPGTAPRLMQGSGVVGTHAAATGTAAAPVANRTGIAAANFIGTNSYRLGINSADVGAFNIASGDWSDPTIWSTGVAPTSTSNVTLQGGYTVTVNNAAALANTVTMAGNAVLNVSGNSLTVTAAATEGAVFTMGTNASVSATAGTINIGTSGAANYFSGMVNNGTLTVSGTAALNVYGYMDFSSTSTFTQSGGTITVDGNKGGVAANSVSSSNSLVRILTLNVTLSGGTFLLVDPHANSTISNSLLFNPSTGSLAANSIYASAAHTFQFGDGASTDAGGNATAQFRINQSGTPRLLFGTMVVNTLTGTNRAVTVLTSNNGALGNLTITSGEFANTASTIFHVKGNVVNNGIMTIPGTLAFQNFTAGAAAANTTAQTLSGSGTFRNLATSATAAFNSITVNNSSNTGVSFTGTGWSAPAATASSTLTFTAGRLNTNGGVFTLGISGTSNGTLSFTAGGFTGGSVFRRWIAAATIAVPAVAGQFPFISSTGDNRSAFLGASSAPTAGTVQVVYTDGSGTSSVTPFADNGATISNVSNASWAVSTANGFALSGTTGSFSVRGDGVATIGNILNIRATGATAPATGTSANGSGTPSNPQANKTTLATSDLAQTFYFGFPGTVVSTATGGAWESGTSWVGGVVPTIADAVAIVSGATITVNVATAAAASVTTNSGASLTVSGSSLTIGQTTYNNPLLNNGTLTVSGGTLKVNGNINNFSGSTFSQTGGTITVDGNDNGNAATSVATGTPIVWFQSNNLTLSGGTIIIVDPHAGAATTDDAFRYSASVSYTSATTGHTLQLGNGVSTDPGNALNTNGFTVELQGSGLITMGNVVVNTVSTGTTANRFVRPRTTSYQPIAGNLTITSGRYIITGSTLVAGNITNNGELISIGLLDLRGISGTSIIANTATQTIGGTGTFANNATLGSSTANFASITTNNSSASGVTFASANSLLSNVGVANTGTISGTFTLVAGLVNTGAGTFILGVAPGTVGTLTYTAGGFSSGSTFSRWFAASTGGSTISAGSNPSGSTGQFPFSTAATGGLDRSFYVNQTTAGTGGKLAVQYNDATTLSTVSIPDNTYVVDRRSDANWIVSSAIGGAPAFSIAANGSGLFTPSNANTRLTTAAGVVGTHAAASSTTIVPAGMRTSVSAANVSNTFYLGISNSDISNNAVATGPWDQASTWSKGTVPTSTELASIPSPYTVTIASGVTATAALLSVASGGALSMTGGTLAVDGAASNGISNSGAITLSGGAMTVGPTGGGNRTFANAGTATLNVSNGTLTVNGNMTFASGTAYNQSGGLVALDGNDNTVANATGVTSTYLLNFASGSTINATAGTLRFIDPLPSANSNYIMYNYVNANGSNYFSGTHTIELGDGTSTAVGGTNGFYMYSWPNSFCAYNNVVVNGGSGYGRWLYSSTVGIAGNLTINSGSVVRQSSSLAVGKTLLNNGTLANTTNTLYFGPYSSGYYTISTPTTYSGTGVYRNTIPTATVAAGGSGYAVGDEVTLVGGTATTAATFVVTSVSSGAISGVTVNNMGSYTAVPSNPVSVTGGTGTGATLTLSTTATSSSYLIPSANLYSLILNNPNGSTLNAPTSISSTFTCTSGILTTTSTNLLTYIGTGTGGGSSTSYVSGPMVKTGTNAYTFPVGKTGTGYQPLTISAPATAATFKTEYMRSSGAALGAVAAAGLTRVSACEYWMLDRTAGTATTNVTLNWNATSGCGQVGNYVTDPTTIVVAHFNGTGWDAYGRDGGVTGDATAGAVTWNNVANFSPFTLGSTGAANVNPLPVAFVNIAARAEKGRNRVEWMTGSEEAVRSYEVEKNIDGAFEALGTLPAQGKASTYTFYDQKPIEGRNTYRIKAVDADGSVSYSQTAMVLVKDDGGFALEAYPNPTTDRIVVRGIGAASAEATLTVTDLAGRVLLSQQDASASATLNLTPLPSGTYLLRWSDGMHQESIRITRQ